jgi:lysophospholipase L1-like esterase
MSFVPLLLDAPAPRAFAMLGILQAVLLLSLLCLRIDWLYSVAITLWLLVIANFALTPYAQTHGELALQPNLHARVQIVGATLPGFTGISTITTDSHGYRVTQAIDYTVPATGLRIFTIGASATEQIYLDDHKTWTHLLQEQLSHDLNKTVEVVNTGMSGLRAEQHYRTLMTIKDYHPNAVIFMMGFNDWNRHIKDSFKRYPLLLDWVDFRKSLLMQPLLKSSANFKAVASTDTKDPNAVRIDDGSYYSSQNNSLTRADQRELTLTRVSDNYAYWTQQIMEQCQAAKLRCIFLDHPNAYTAQVTDDLKRRFWMTPPNERYTLSLASMQQISSFYNDWLLDFAGKHGLGVCRINPQLEPGTSNFYDDCHVNENGARTLANALGSCVGSLLR